MRRILRGWKEIEDFLGFSRKTIIMRGFPVRRIGGTNSSVIAFCDELARHMHKKGLMADREAAQAKNSRKFPQIPANSRKFPQIPIAPACAHLLCLRQKRGFFHG